MHYWVYYFDKRSELVKKKECLSFIFSVDFSVVFADFYNNLSSHKCKLSSNVYKLSSKTIIIFPFIAENLLQII